MKQPKEKYAHYGLYMVVMSLLVLAIVVLGNGIAHRLPVSWTQFDTSASRLYSLSPQTEEIAAGLTEDVTLYLVAPTGEEDETLLRLLQKYEALSEHITTSTVDPVLSPTFVQTYTSAKVSDNSILVVGAERSRVIRNSDLYPSNYDYDTGRTSTEFDGEGQITSAIHYVTSDAVSKIYLVTGHGEDALSESFTAALEKEGVAQESLNLTSGVGSFGGRSGGADVLSGTGRPDGTDQRHYVGADAQSGSGFVGIRRSSGAGNDCGKRQQRCDSILSQLPAAADPIPCDHRSVPAGEWIAAAAQCPCHRSSG